MRWQACPNEGWHTGFAWVPTVCSCGTVVWMEPYRYYLNNFGLIATILKGSP